MVKLALAIQKGISKFLLLIRLRIPLLIHREYCPILFMKN